MIRQVDEDHENKINFKGFLTIFRKANNGELKQESGLQQLFQSISIEIDVAETGVKGAKDFFEAQVIKKKQVNFEILSILFQTRITIVTID